MRQFNYPLLVEIEATNIQIVPPQRTWYRAVFLSGLYVGGVLHNEGDDGHCSKLAYKLIRAKSLQKEYVKIKKDCIKATRPTSKVDTTVKRSTKERAYLWI